MEDLEKRARESALHFLSFRPRSIAEVQTFLLEKKTETEIIESIITSLSETKFLDDEQFAQWWAESRIRGGKSGPFRIRQELQRKGIAKDVIDKTMQRDWKRIASETLKRAAGKMTERDPKKRIQKLQSLLARSGFTWEQIQGAVDSLNQDR